MTLAISVPLTMEVIDLLYEQFYLKVNGEFVGPFDGRKKALDWYRNRVGADSIWSCSLWAAHLHDTPSKFLYVIV